ncbi:uncharacterized protein PHALS_12353 [Plasmopara halstedii]|uniref:Uncharacterized protein n=1 Tax=Plasmopara halstedii TaxID=4781 RepID=A0A0P1AKW4_PLAHL|nr:uncharacterized protein PHALS_12353 [Plasmopara halstedii]CEG42047.1 hypothetical protein PHALS_12353 [Plasmopara halstedii]|eukprot:XP_024578416.1 hypothetical protein PHALS_12353 [Plasmopara halstedii]
MPEEMRCQYSSKRCESERTNKKSGGLHKFCAMHREKANRNQMRLDQRRRVVKQQQKDLQRQQQAQRMQTFQVQQLQRPLCCSPAAMAAGQNYNYMHRTQRSPMNTLRSSMNAKSMSPPDMTISIKRQEAPHLPLFDQHDLEILEALLFSSDDEQSDAAPVTHCNASHFLRAPSFVNV